MELQRETNCKVENVTFAPNSSCPGCFPWTIERQAFGIERLLCFSHCWWLKWPLLLLLSQCHRAESGLKAAISGSCGLALTGVALILLALVCWGETGGDSVGVCAQIVPERVN